MPSSTPTSTPSRTTPVALLAVGARSSNTGKSRLFACPFLKFNPIENAECRHYRLKRVSDVKQHNLRRHLLARHLCIICWSGFDDEVSKTRHLRYNNCQPRQQPEELSAEELKEIKLPRGGDPEDHWRAIWNHLFRDYTPPSPYIPANPITEVKDLIYPNVEEEFLARFPSLLKNNNSEMDLKLFFRSIMDQGFEAFCRRLPTSRHLSPAQPEFHELTPEPEACGNEILGDPEFSMPLNNLDWDFVYGGNL